MSLLNTEQIEKKLQSFNNWSISDKIINKKFKFNSYMESIRFINEIAIKAEELNHHPDILLGYCEIVLGRFHRPHFLDLVR